MKEGEGKAKPEEGRASHKGWLCSRAWTSIINKLCSLLCLCSMWMSCEYGLAIDASWSGFISCAAATAASATPSSVPKRCAPAKPCLFAVENGRAEGAKAKGEGEGKARTAMGGAERLDAVRLVTYEAVVLFIPGRSLLHVQAFVSYMHALPIQRVFSMRIWVSPQSSW